MPSKAVTHVDPDPEGQVSSSVVLDYIRDPAGTPITARINEDPDVVAFRIMNETLAAESAEELFGPREVLHAQDVIGQPFVFRSVAWLPSDQDGDGFPFYGAFSVADADGETHVLTCGAKSVILKLAKADLAGWLPRRLKIVQTDKPTASGRYPLDIVDAPLVEGF